MQKIKWILIGVLLILLVYTRFINIGWGFPYPMHPDERNMAAAIQELHGLRPNFFAYGQFTLYLGYFLIQIYHFFSGQIGAAISFVEAAMSLRIISAIASVFTVIVLLEMFELLGLYGKVEKKNFLLYISSFLILIFSPALIQFSHFGTTESLLIFFYSLIIYYSLLLLKKKILNSKFLILNSLLCGLAAATKVSSIIFVAVPLAILLFRKEFLLVIRLIVLTALITIIFSPYNLIDWQGFIGSMKYETAVARGTEMVFYTRQFVGSLPIFFQMEKIFPYALGWPVFLLALLGFFGLSFKDKTINLLRFAFLVYFLSNAFLFAKWTRFMAPVFPLMIIFALLFLKKISILNSQFSKLIVIVSVFISIISGISYLSIYQNPDVRAAATDWINDNIPEKSYILSETANVVDIPLANSKYALISFDFYNLDVDRLLQIQLPYHLRQAGYIFVPSRRIFMNHTNDAYPKLTAYYDKLFSGKLGFSEVAEFNSYPKITLFGRKIIEFPDEQAEETWTVFDHPVVRIYKKTSL